MQENQSQVTERVNLLNFDVEGIKAWCAALGEKPYRAIQLSRWMHRHCEDDFDAMSNLAKSFRAKLHDLAYIKAPPVITVKHSADGTRKWLFDVGNGNAVEAVFIPEDDRGTLCISTQAGCAMGCLFCSTGKQGFNRNLTTAEIVGQLWHAERTLRKEAGVTDPNDRIISNVVLMGMGEPLQNLSNVIPALRLFLDDNGYGLSRRRVTVSTSGLVNQIDKLGSEVPVALAVSLHAPDDALRDMIMPVNKKHPLEDLMAACRRYLKVAPRDFITFEYLMLGGINDQPKHARELIELVRTGPCKFNLITFNPFPDSDLKRPERETVLAFAKILNDAGIVTTIRKTRGDDIDAACGQLAGEVKDRTRRAERLLEQNEGIRAVVITSPTYDGVVSDVERIAEIVHKKSIPLIIDEAHGAHFGFHSYFPENSNTKGADLVIHSLHKTMPSLTQTAMLHINGQIADRENIRRYLHMIQTSSPSYILMASIDECIRTVRENGEELFESYTGILRKTREELSGLTHLKLIEYGDPKQGQYDRSKIVISGKDLVRVGREQNEASKRISCAGGRELCQALIREHHIQPEMAAGSYIIAMTGPADTEEGMKRFVRAMRELDGQTRWEERENAADDPKLRNPEMVCTSWEAERLRASGIKTERVSWHDAAGRTAMEYAYLYPPGIPLIVPGEKIGRGTAAQIEAYEKKGFTIEGTRIHGKPEVMING